MLTTIHCTKMRSEVSTSLWVERYRPRGQLEKEVIGEKGKWERIGRVGQRMGLGRDN